MSQYAIEFENVSRHYRLHHEAKLTLQDRVVNIFKKNSSYEDFWALKDISFKLERGKTLGIIGKNGAGKSTLLKLATRILEPSSGTIRVTGRVSAMLELGTGFHPELSARDNIYLNGAFYGFDRKDMDERYERILEFSELGKFIDTPVKHFSTGMYMRLGFAIAITVSPDILIIDEVLAVGDAAFGRKCHRAIEELKSQSKAMLFVSHAAGDISRYCDEVIYISKGQIVARGNPNDVLDEYSLESMSPTYFTPKPTTATALTPSVAIIIPKSRELISTATLSDFNNGQHYRVNNGVLHRELNNSWQFNLPESSSVKNELAQYHLAILNPHEHKIKLEIVGYQQTGSVFDEAIGALREIPMGKFELVGQRLELIKLPSIANTNLIKLTSTDVSAAEFVEYQPNRQVQTYGWNAPVTPGMFRYFPFCDIRGDNLCHFRIFNPTNQPVEVSMTLFRDWDDVLPKIRIFRCAAHAQMVLDLNQELAGGEGEFEHGQHFYGSILFKTDVAINIQRYNLQLTSVQPSLMPVASLA